MDDTARASAVAAPTVADPIVAVRGVTKRFGPTTAVDHVSLEIRRGEFFALLGPSGCGKTTLLRMLAGFESPDAGQILIDGAEMAQVPPHRRPVNMMFQSYALFPHMTVEQNVAFGLRQDRRLKDEIQARVGEMLDLVQLRALAGRKPAQLSGGQRQRVALARALAKHPKLLLLDEPLAALDRKLREETQFELVGIQRRVGITFVVVTHDQDEAMTMASRMAVMDRGRIRQLGTPEEVYENPANRFIADFIGAANLFTGRVAALAPDHVTVDSAEAGGLLLAAPGEGVVEGAEVAVAVRPEKVAVSALEPKGAANAVAGRVRDVGYAGDVSIFNVALASGKVVRAAVANASRTERRVFAAGETVWLTWPAVNAIALLD
jgi:putrescine transport system ATP-binding protein